MEIVSVLALLRRYWYLVVPGFALAALAGVQMMYGISLNPPGLLTRETSSGLAVGQSMLTTTAAPTFRLSDKSYMAGTLPYRAVMLTNVMASDANRTAIERRAGIENGSLAVFGSAGGTPPFVVPISQEATAAAQTGREPYRVTVTTQSSPPLITVRASAAQAGDAAKIVDAVRQQMDDVLAKGQPGEERIGITSLGPVTANQVPGESPAPKAAIAVFVVLVMWCGGVVVLMGALPRLRRRPDTAPAAS